MLTKADSKAVCRENLEGGQQIAHEEATSHCPESPPDVPPDSFWVSKEEEIEWFDRNAFMVRRGSTKLSTHRSLSLNPKMKTSTVGSRVPKSHHYSCFSGGRSQRSNKPATNVTLLRSRSEPVGKTGVFSEGNEPGSPLVSCTGRVRSKRVHREKMGFWGILKAAFRGSRAVSKNSSGSIEPVVESAGSVGQ